MNLPENDFSANVERFSGFADVYDRYRPQPPAVLAPLLLQLAGVDEAELVVDLGSGTGLSTRYWAGKARAVVGIEPSADMRSQAQSQTLAQNITYRAGFSHQTGLPDACASIVTCSQSLHWMDPQATFFEARRILQSGGVFAAFDYDWPPTTGSWQADQAYTVCMERARQLEAAYQSAKNVRSWDKPHHLERMQTSGCFRYTKEIVIHHLEAGNAERLVGVAVSQGGVMSLLKRGLTEAELGLDHLRAVAEKELGSDPRDWIWSSRVRIGIR